MADGEVDDDREFIDNSDLPPDAKKLFNDIEKMEKLMNKGDGTIPVTPKKGKKVIKGNMDYINGVSAEKVPPAKYGMHDRDDRED